MDGRRRGSARPALGAPPRALDRSSFSMPALTLTSPSLLLSDYEKRVRGTLDEIGEHQKQKSLTTGGARLIASVTPRVGPTMRENYEKQARHVSEKVGDTPSYRAPAAVPARTHAPQSTAPSSETVPRVMPKTGAATVVHEGGGHGRSDRVESPPARDERLARFEERLARKLGAAGGTKKERVNRTSSLPGNPLGRAAPPSTTRSNSDSYPLTTTQGTTFEERFARKIEHSGRGKKGSHEEPTSKKTPEQVSQACDESWECSTCAFLNVQEGPDPVAVCQMCHQPKDIPLVTAVALAVPFQGARAQTARDIPLRKSAPARIAEDRDAKDQLDVSWSELGNALAMAVTHSMCQSQTAPPDCLAESKEESQKRMLRRTTHQGATRRGSGHTFSQMTIAETILDNTADSGAKDEAHGLDSCKELIRSASASSLCPGSWECRKCTYINEPVGLDPCTVCQVCRTHVGSANKYPTESHPEPSDHPKTLHRVRRKKTRYRQRRRSASKNDMNKVYSTWSDLGGTIAADVTSIRSIEGPAASHNRGSCPTESVDRNHRSTEHVEDHQDHSLENGDPLSLPAKYEHSHVAFQPGNECFWCKSGSKIFHRVKVVASAWDSDSDTIRYKIVFSSEGFYRKNVLRDELYIDSSPQPQIAKHSAVREGTHLPPQQEDTEEILSRTTKGGKHPRELTVLGEEKRKAEAQVLEVTAKLKDINLEIEAAEKLEGVRQKNVQGLE